MLQKLLFWWLRQIKTMIPAEWLHAWEHTASVLAIQIQSPHLLQLSARFKHTTLPGGDFALVQDNLSHQDAIQHFIQTLPLPPSHILLQCRPCCFMVSDVSLPLAAETNLTQTLTFQISQLTPFKSDEAIFFCGIQQRFPDQKKLVAWLVVVPHHVIQPALALLQPLSPVLLHGPSAPPKPDQPLQLTYRVGNKRRWFSLSNPVTFVFLGLFIFSCVLGLHVYNRSQSNDYLQQQVIMAREQASQAHQLQEHLTSLQRQANELTAHKSSAVPVLMLWNDVTQRLTDDTWLYQFEVQGRELSVRGVSADTSLLIQLLEASPYLNNVSFMAAVTRDQQANKERFFIGADIIVSGDL